MVDKKILAITILLILGAGGVLLKDKWGVENTLKVKAPGEVVSMLSVDGLLLKSGDGEAKLQKQADGRWQMADGFPADANKVVRFLETLEKIKFQRKVTSNPNGFGEFGLDSPNEVVVHQDGKEVLALLVGDRRDRGGQYYGVKGQEEAYLGDPALAVDPSPAAWELKQLIDVKPEQVKKIQFADVSLIRDKKEDALKVADPKGGKETNAVKSAANLLASLNFSNRFSKDYAQAGEAFAKPEVATIETFDGKRYLVSVGTAGKEEKHYLKIQVEGESLPREDQWINQVMQEHIFEVGKWQADKFRKSRKDYVESKKS